MPSGIAAVTVALTPFWMIGVEALLPGGERLSPRALTGLLVGFGGIVLLVWSDLAGGGPSGRQFGLGMVALQVACLGWALGSSYSRRRVQRGNTLTTAGMQMLFGGLIMLIAATAGGEWRDLTFTKRSLGAEVYLGAIGSLAGYPAYIYALKHLPVSIVSLYAYANPS